jgi:CheY-like chemotaxis protein
VKPAQHPLRSAAAGSDPGRETPSSRTLRHSGRELTDAQCAAEVLSEGECFPRRAAVPPRVLLMDDERQLLELMRKALRAMGCIADAVTSAEDALDLLESDSYDAVISDLHMPGMDGEQFHLYLTKHWPALAGHFVLMTGDILSTQSAELLQRTDLRVLRKPFSLEELLTAVGEVLDRPR